MEVLQRLDLFVRTIQNKKLISVRQTLRLVLHL